MISNLTSQKPRTRNKNLRSRNKELSTDPTESTDKCEKRGFMFKKCRIT
jgi:hypothetical protein